MALLPYTRMILSSVKYNVISKSSANVPVRNLMSKQLIYSEFGDPVRVVKFRECEVPPLGSQDVLVRMLAAPVNPADINTIQGINLCLPTLPSVPGDEGVGEIVETGKHVGIVKPGNRVIINSPNSGTWRYFGIYNERCVYVVANNLPLAEASMLAIAPCMAYRMIKDYRYVKKGETIIQNAANSACGQSVIQLCKAWDINTLNIVANHCGYEAVKEYLLGLGATAVYTKEEAEELLKFDTSLTRPVLALNCLGGSHEDVMLRLLQHRGVIVNYGWAFNLPIVKQCMRCDVQFYKFHLCDWEARASVIDKDVMLREIIELMVIGSFKAPAHRPVELKNYMHAISHTVHCEAFSTYNFLFDFTLP